MEELNQGVRPLMEELNQGVRPLMEELNQGVRPLMEELNQGVRPLMEELNQGVRPLMEELNQGVRPLMQNAEKKFCSRSLLRVNNNNNIITDFNNTSHLGSTCPSTTSSQTLIIRLTWVLPVLQRHHHRL
nr:apolipoprotein A-I-like [Oncorhynchus nerka]